MTKTASETRRIHGRDWKVGDTFFRSADFRATLVDGDDDYVIVRDDLDGDDADDLLFEWRADRMERRSEENETRALRRGTWVLIATDSDAERGIVR